MEAMLTWKHDGSRVLHDDPEHDYHGQDACEEDAKDELLDVLAPCPQMHDSSDKNSYSQVSLMLRDDEWSQARLA